MHLNKLILHNFKKYRRAEIEFQDGLTGIVGGNGTGKSTIVEAIAWALYGNRASIIKREFLKNTEASENEPVEVQLSLSIGRQDVAIYRGMRGRSLVPEARLKIDGIQVAAGTKEVDLQLESLIRISFQDFMKTFYARQKDLDNLLREGGTGKREYLLKLLGLDEIREAAVERIKLDLKSATTEKERLAGALSEIGDVESRLKAIEQQIAAARSAKDQAMVAEENAASAANDSRLRIRKMEEQKRAGDQVLSDLKRNCARSAEIAAIVKRERDRLDEIRKASALLLELEPRLSRLTLVRAQLEREEPVRAIHEELSKKHIRAMAELEGRMSSLSSMEQDQAALKMQSVEMEQLTADERTYQDLQLVISDMERKRDQYSTLHARQSREQAKIEEIEKSMHRSHLEISELKKAARRMVELSPYAARHEELRSEMEGLKRTRDSWMRRQEAATRRLSVEKRIERLHLQQTRLQESLTALGDMDEVSTRLMQQDQALDSLSAELNERLVEQKSLLGVESSKLSEVRRNLNRANTLGAGSTCPTCERPLGEQHAILMEKYRGAQAECLEKENELRREIEALLKRIDNVSGSRSRLKSAFDDLNAKKARRAAVTAELQSANDSLLEAAEELSGIDIEVKPLLSIEYDQEAHDALAKEYAENEKRVALHAALATKVSELPRRERDHGELAGQAQAGKKSLESIDKEIEALGLREEDYKAAKEKLAALKPLHKRYEALRQKVSETATVEEKVRLLKREVEERRAAVETISSKINALGFDEAGYEALSKERKLLIPIEARANDLRLKAAGEIMAVSRLEEATVEERRLAAEERELQASLTEIGYSEPEHRSAIVDLKQKETTMEAARHAASEKMISLRVLEDKHARLKEERRRRTAMEQELADQLRRAELLESCKGLIQRFMDQILIRVKKEIATAAGNILEEVTGKYSIIKIDEEFNILVEEGGEFYPIWRFSGGEIDMIAVSVRVAISEYLMRFQQGSPGYSFLILDEIFGSADVEHREKMIEMLRHLDSRFPQIFAISHISDVQGQFDNTITVIEDESSFCSRVEVG